MDVQVLFTKTDKIGSHLIRGITKEPVSHCAFRVGDIVVHSGFYGVNIQPYSYFARHNDIVFSVDIDTSSVRIKSVLDKFYGKRYDFGAFFYLGLRLLFPLIVPKQNLWQTTGMFVCTEFISKGISDEEDSMITPFQLYTKIAKQQYLQRRKN